MSGKFIPSDLGLNVTLFQGVLGEMHAWLKPLALFFGIAGNYWTAPLIILALVWWARSVTNPAKANKIWYRLIGFISAILVGTLAGVSLELLLDFSSPSLIVNELVRVLGERGQYYGLLNGQAIYSAIVVGTLWPLVGYRGRFSLLLYVVLVGWSSIVAGMYAPVSLLTGWSLGLGSVCLSTLLFSIMVRVRLTTYQGPILVWYVIAVCTFLADQLTKFFIVNTFSYGEQVEVTAFINFVYVLNPGAAFSFLANADGWQRYFFITLGLLISVWLIRMLKQGLPRIEALGYSLILGGALGNVSDRLFRLQVVDFLDFHWQYWHWPTFNLADVSIISGAALLIISTISQGKVAEKSMIESYKRLN